MRLVQRLWQGMSPDADQTQLVMRMLSSAALRAFLLRGFRRTPLGFVATLLLRKALMGEGRVFGMDLASRRQARMAWLAGLMRSAKTAEKNAPIRRRLSR